MKVAIDSYSYHRYFGEWYEGLQNDIGSRKTIWEFLEEAKQLQVKGVSLESCFLDGHNPEFRQQLKATLTASQLEVVWAWGHPDGLGSGNRPHELDDLIANIYIAKEVGAKAMRICCGSRRTRIADWQVHKEKLLPLLQQATAIAQEQGVALAIENHIDFLADELVDLLNTINSPFLGVCLDTANNLRVFEDPLTVAKKLAPFVKATHIKDIRAERGQDPKTFAFWPSVPVGDGLIDIPGILKVLKEHNYQGLLAIELDYLKDQGEEDALRKSINYLNHEVNQL